ncbi:F-type H+-transporting ATPase subunit [Syntrophobacter sp. SbD1]|nr:F-type H+-transporting ATPase subunit [Syntrophobacter sp. SbD1]
MSEKDSPEKRPSAREEFSRRVSRKEARKLKVRGRKGQEAWFGLGMFGLIGWSLALPAVAGTFLGAWIDRTWPSRYSWTLTFLLGGVILGALNAWHWVGQERKKIEKDR